MVEQVVEKVPAWVVKSILGILMVAVGGIGGSVVSNVSPSKGEKGAAMYTRYEAEKDRELYLSLIRGTHNQIVDLKEDLAEIKQDVKALIKR